MDAKTRQVMAFHVGDRTRQSAKQLWVKIPRAYRQHATFYTDQYMVYEGVVPAAQHRAISKLARNTNYIERFDNMLRQRVSRWYMTCCRSPRSSPITLAPSSCSSATTT